MPVASSNSRVEVQAEASQRASATAQLAIVAGSYLPFLHAGSTAASGLWAWWSDVSWAWGVPMVWLYVVPALGARVLVHGGEALDGSYGISDSGFRRWWLACQLQVVFNRFPALEELLRMVPMLYSAWLRLWGAKIGKNVYWSPGVRVYDRPLLELGDRVVVGVSSRWMGHYLTRLRDPEAGDGGNRGEEGEAGSDAEAGPLALFVGRNRVDADAIIGGFSMVPPSAQVPARAVTRHGRTAYEYVRGTGLPGWDRRVSS